MLIQKPQFDVDFIKVGSAYQLCKYNYKRYLDINTSCIITKVSPLMLYVAYVRKDDNKICEISININEVTDKTFELNPMEVVRNG
jgi:hypothetical protein